MEKLVNSLEEFNTEAALFIAELTPREDSATLVTLSGELGAGKTAFVKAVAKTLGVPETVNSPTFVLEKIYELPEGNQFKRLVHIDAYRLNGGNELSPLGFDELMKDSRTVVLLEWPEKVAEGLTHYRAEKISIEVVSEQVRKITYGENS